MRINVSYPGKFIGRNQQPYITINLTWEEAKEYVREFEDPTTMFRSDVTITRAIYAELAKATNNE